MLYGFVLLIGVLGIGVYLLVVVRNIPGSEDRFGHQKPLPEDVGEWKPDRSFVAKNNGLANVIREIRVWRSVSAVGREKLLLQARLRDETSGEIVEVLDDRRIDRETASNL